MPGAPITHGYSISPPLSSGGAGRVAATSNNFDVGFPSSTSFIVWLVVLGVVVPGLIIGGLKYGGFQFVFKGR